MNIFIGIIIVLAGIIILFLVIGLLIRRDYSVGKEVVDNQTKVHWEFTGKMKYPTNLMLLFMNMEKMVGGDLDKGLQNLKSVLEK